MVAINKFFMFRHQNSIFVSVLFVLTGACLLSIMTQSIMTLNIKGINMTVSIKTLSITTLP